MVGIMGFMCVGIFFGMWYFNDWEFVREYGFIIKVVVYVWDCVDGFEVWYGGVSSGFCGRCGGLQRELEVGDLELIVCVIGYVGQWLDLVSFFVSFNKYINGGNGMDNFCIGFVEDCFLNEMDIFCLDYVYGWFNSGSGFIEGFGVVFCWVEIL